ncbi:hypothetical protein JW859_06630 [bacterium]|nr:hypothetical protein [bacterium]
MPRDKRAVIGGLERKGFKPKDKDHKFYNYFDLSGHKTSVFTKVSHSGKEISDNLLGSMARQCRLKRADFDALVDCPLDQPKYEKLLREKGVIN